MTVPSRQYLHLKPLQLSQLPTHPLLKPPQPVSSASPSLRAFLTEVLTEAILFSDTTVPTHFKPKGAPKESKGAAAHVQLLTWDGEAAQGVSGEDKESWFARQSSHDDVKGQGSADWEEFVNGLFHKHSENEMEYTPDVYDAHRVLDWDDDCAQLNAEGWGDNVWSDVGMEVFEMAHSIPFPLNNRVFPVLVVRALTGNHKQASLSQPNPTTTSPPGFIVAQIPIDLTSLPDSLYSSGRHRKDGDSAKKRASVTMGRYVSVERVMLDEGSGSDSEGKKRISWMMTTASDAGGNLPISVQKLGVPGAVIKDVGLFIGWTRRVG